MKANRSVLIQTPEGILFHLPLAGPIGRFLAWIVDFACVSVVTTVVATLVGAVGLVSADLAEAIGIIAFFIILIGYPIFCEWRLKGQTVGKRLFGLRVIDAQGLGLQLNQIVIRNLLRVVDLLPLLYLVGGAVSLLTSRSQRLGDLAANTIVVRDERLPKPDLDQLVAPRYNSLREHPHLVARLRRRISQQETEIALEALVRRDDLEPLARARLFEEIAGDLKGLVALPQETFNGITDEQFVRNVIDVLFATRFAAGEKNDPAPI
jgi:uncharacterized RDD family membrane protein YckC